MLGNDCGDIDSNRPTLAANRQSTLEIKAMLRRLADSLRREHDLGERCTLEQFILHLRNELLALPNAQQFVAAGDTIRLDDKHRFGGFRLLEIVIEAAGEALEEKHTFAEPESASKDLDADAAFTGRADAVRKDSGLAWNHRDYRRYWKGKRSMKHGRASRPAEIGLKAIRDGKDGGRVLYYDRGYYGTPNRELNMVLWKFLADNAEKELRVVLADQYSNAVYSEVGAGSDEPETTEYLRGWPPVSTSREGRAQGPRQEHRKVDFGISTTDYSPANAIWQQDLLGYAMEIGIDDAAFSTCLASGRMRQRWQDDQSNGLEMGVAAKPTFFFNGRIVTGNVPFEPFRQIIEQELRGSGDHAVRQ